MKLIEAVQSALALAF
jgi:isocitrate dehydrogenase